MPRVCAKYTTDRMIYQCWASDGRRRLTGIAPAMGYNAGRTLNRNLVSRPTSSVQVHSRQVLKDCWPAPAMVVEGIQVKIYLNLSSWFFP